MFESATIRQSICQCVNPFKIRDKQFAECKFYDDAGKEVACVFLPNGRIYESERLFISQDGKNIILPSYIKGETTCYSLQTGKVLWKSPIEKSAQIFAYKDKLFCEWSTSKGGVTILDANTGKIIKEAFNYKTEELNPPYCYRLSERYLMIYILGYVFLYDMEEDKTLFCQIRFNEPSWNYGLKEIIYTDSPSQVVLKFRETAPPNIIFTQQAVYIKDLTNFKPSPFGNKIPTKKEVLEKAYSQLFNLN